MTEENSNVEILNPAPVPDLCGGYATATRLKTADQCAKAVWSNWRIAVDHILATGEVLLRAKEVVAHGGWTDFCKALPFGESTAARLMKVARDERLLRAAEAKLLPPDWATLYELTKLDDDEFTRFSGDGTINPGMRRQDLTQARSVARMNSLAATILDQPLDGQYRTILADPPWKYDTWSEAGKNRSPERHYPCMELEEIAAFEADGRHVSELAAKDCALFMWVSSPHAGQAMEVIGRWGFTFKTVAFVWVKAGNAGTWRWTRPRTEICLLATRGAPKRIATDVDQLIEEGRREHSRKPDEIYRRIERLVPGPYLELFSRTTWPGWDCTGNETGKFDAGTG